MNQCLNAARLQMDWRPLAGLTPADAGTVVERVLAEVVVATVLEAHNADIEK